MIRALQRYFSGIPAVFIDGLLYTLIAVFGATLAILTSEEVYKYLGPYTIFYLKSGTSIGLAGASAIKMFRSTAYSDHQEKKKSDTQFFRAEPNKDIPTP